VLAVYCLAWLGSQPAHFRVSCIVLSDGLTTSMTHLWASLKRRIAELIRALDPPHDRGRDSAAQTDDDTRGDGPWRMTR
jgi:hypothetical protein